MNIINGVVKGAKLVWGTAVKTAMNPKVQKVGLTLTELGATYLLGKLEFKEQKTEMQKVANEVFDSKIVKFSDYQKI